jgi:hypothetical protein
MATKLVRVPSREELEFSSEVDDSLASFQTEAEVVGPVQPIVPPSKAAPAPGLSRRFPLLVPFATMGVLAVAAVAIAYVFQVSQSPAASAPALPVVPLGTVTFTSEPSGANVVVDGVARGATPLKMQLPAGPHDVEIVAANGTKRLPMTVEAATVMSQHVEFAAAAVAETGRLEVTSEPSGARVTVDGAQRGTTPLNLPDVAVGEHRIAIATDSTSVQRTVTVAAGATASVMVALSAPGSAGGFARLDSPVELQVYEGGQLIGTTSASRLMLPAGRHDLEVANSALEFQVPIRIDIQPGRTTAATVPVPNGSLSINALPWAEITLDGKPIGTTPLGNVSVPIGTHEIVWRHPQLGERTRTITVPARTPVRLGMDLNR